MLLPGPGCWNIPDADADDTCIGDGTDITCNIQETYTITLSIIYT